MPAATRGDRRPLPQGCGRPGGPAGSPDRSVVRRGVSDRPAVRPGVSGRAGPRSPGLLAGL